MKKLSLPEIKERQIKILDTIVDFCEKNSLKYSLIGGSLLGAVRHKGYIPWDDDIDLYLFRKDYDFFVENFKIDGYKVYTSSSSDGYNLTFAKVSDENTLLVEVSTMKNSIGVNVDIFPVDNYPDDPNEAKRFFNELNIYKKMLTYKQVKIANTRSFFKNLILFILHILFSPISQKKLAKIIEKKAVRYKDIDANYVACIVFTVYGYEKEKFTKDIFSSYTKLEFEGKLYNVPVGYDKLLTKVFGDYMTLPPPEKRVTHHNFKAYLK